MTGGGRSPWRFALPAVIAGVTVAAFLPTLFNGLLDWDDNVAITENPFVRGVTWTNVHWAFTTFLLGHYHPLTWLSFMLDTVLWGQAPWGYHLTNLLLHAACAIAFYAILRRLLRARDAELEPERSFAAAAGALLFAVHPLRVESVAWATERRDVLSGFLLLLTVLFYLRKQLAVSLACYAASLLSKSIGATLPVVLLVLDAYPLGRLRTGPGWFARTRRVVIEKLPFLALGLGVGLIALLAEGREGGARSLLVHGLPSRLAQAAYGIVFYLWKTLVPIRLSPLYLLEDGLDPRQPVYLISGAIVVTVTATLVLLRRRWPAGLCAWLCYLAVVAPMLGLCQVGLQKVADRYTYLPCLAFAALASGGLLALEKRRTTAWAAAGLVIASLSVLTFRQSALWNDSATLWGQAIRVDPGNYAAYNYRGLARQKAGDSAGAIDDFEQAIPLRPDLGYFYRSIVRLAAGDLDGALHDLDRSIELRPGYAMAHLNRAVVRMRRDDTAGAQADCEAALKADPRVGEAHNILGVIRDMRGDPEGAVQQFGEAVSIEPSLVNAWLNRARALAKLERLDDALADYDTAMTLDPGNADIPNDRGTLLLQHGDAPNARKSFDAALARNPRHAFALLNRCFVRQLQKDLAGAIEDCDAALDVDHRLVEAYVARAKARELSGDAEGARADLTHALSLLPKDAPLRADVEALLAAAAR